MPGRRVQRGVTRGGMEIAGDAGPYLTPDEEVRQAAWYEAYRRELYRQLGFRRLERILEVGCGSGVVTAELAGRAAKVAVGLDRRLEALAAARARGSGAAFVAGDVAALPFRDGVFDAAAGAFVITWLAEPAAFLREAERVLKSGGVYVAVAEPDYEGAIDYPPAASSRDDVVEAVRRRGGDPAAGRKLPALLSGAGFDVFRFGVLNSAWTTSRWAEEEEKEFELLERLVGASAAGERLRVAARARRAAISSGERCYFLPIFFAAARKVR